jgi:hypothetical protein
MLTLPAVTLRKCAVCGALAEITHEELRLPCSHFAYLTERGVVIGWINTAAVALNLLRAMGEPVDTRWEWPATGVASGREQVLAVKLETQHG